MKSEFSDEVKKEIDDTIKLALKMLRNYQRTGKSPQVSAGALLVAGGALMRLIGADEDVCKIAELAYKNFDNYFKVEDE